MNVQRDFRCLHSRPIGGHRGRELRRDVRHERAPPAGLRRINASSSVRFLTALATSAPGRGCVKSPLSDWCAALLIPFLPWNGITERQVFLRERS